MENCVMFMLGKYISLISIIKHRKVCVGLAPVGAILLLDFPLCCS